MISKKSKIYCALISVFILASFGLFFRSNLSLAQTVSTVTGWAWSDRVGYISFNCTNTNSCTKVDYSVKIDKSTGNLSGYAWSDAVGWISFQDGIGDTKARIDLAGLDISNFQSGPKLLKGRAKILSDDSWILLSGSVSNSEYGVRLNSDGSLSGYAWHDNYGWINFDPVIQIQAEPYFEYYGVRTEGIANVAVFTVHGAGFKQGAKVDLINYDCAINRIRCDTSGIIISADGTQISNIKCSMTSACLGGWDVQVSVPYGDKMVTESLSHFSGQELTIAPPVVTDLIINGALNGSVYSISKISSNTSLIGTTLSISKEGKTPISCGRLTNRDDVSGYAAGGNLQCIIDSTNLKTPEGRSGWYVTVINSKSGSDFWSVKAATPISFICTPFSSNTACSAKCGSVDNGCGDGTYNCSSANGGMTCNVSDEACSSNKCVCLKNVTNVCSNDNCGDISVSCQNTNVTEIKCPTRIGYTCVNKKQVINCTDNDFEPVYGICSGSGANYFQTIRYQKKSGVVCAGDRPSGSSETVNCVCKLNDTNSWICANGVATQNYTTIPFDTRAKNCDHDTPQEKPSCDGVRRSSMCSGQTFIDACRNATGCVGSKQADWVNKDWPSEDLSGLCGSVVQYDSNGCLADKAVAGGLSCNTVASYGCPAYVSGSTTTNLDGTCKTVLQECSRNHCVYNGVSQSHGQWNDRSRWICGNDQIFDIYGHTYNCTSGGCTCPKDWHCGSSHYCLPG